MKPFLFYVGIERTGPKLMEPRPNMTTDHEHCARQQCLLNFQRRLKYGLFNNTTLARSDFEVFIRRLTLTAPRYV